MVTRGYSPASLASPWPVYTIFWHLVCFVCIVVLHCILLHFDHGGIWGNQWFNWRGREFKLLLRGQREWKKKRWSVHPLKQTMELHGKYVLVQQTRDLIRLCCSHMDTQNSSRCVRDARLAISHGHGDISVTKCDYPITLRNKIWQCPWQFSSCTIWNVSSGTLFCQKYVISVEQHAFCHLF